jgi:hypothetical protein
LATELHKRAEMADHSTVLTSLRGYVLKGAIPLGLVALFLSCRSAPPQPAAAVSQSVSNIASAPAAAPSAAHTDTHVEIVNVNIYLDPQLSFSVYVI